MTDTVKPDACGESTTWPDTGDDSAGGVVSGKYRTWTCTLPRGHVQVQVQHSDGTHHWWGL